MKIKKKLYRTAARNARWKEERTAGARKIVWERCGTVTGGGAKGEKEGGLLGKGEDSNRCA